MTTYPPTPLLFFHGIGSTGASWRGQIEHFGDRYRCVGLDLPGYGETPPLAENNFETLSAWLMETIKANGWERPILVGNSYGGMLVQEFVYRYPGIVRAIVLFGTSPAFGKKDGEWQ
ncbi:MAG: alpha/beta fold hydrolase, partial [Chloroflexota bacterium]